jgi:hypothetical protein
MLFLTVPVEKRIAAIPFIPPQFTLGFKPFAY